MTRAEERAQARREYQRDRAAMMERHAEERRELNRRHEEEAAALWRTFCAAAIPAEVSRG